MNTPLRIVFAFILLFIAQLPAKAQKLSRSQWVDSVYNTLSETERIGQLFMVAAYSGGKNYNEADVTKLVEANQVGGLIFMQGTPEAQAEQNNKYQKTSKVPLLIAMDAEWGLGMRLTGVKDMPRQMMIGATKDTVLAYQLGVAVAEQCKRLGVHVNFAPVVDVNNNPKNPIINARSFGENKEWVAKLGIAYMRGMQDNGIIACAKHFPGHGDTETDSHKDLPTITKSIEQLEQLEMYPFRELINAGIMSVMVAHLDIPALETEPHIPTTLSSNTINGYLKGKMKFDGLVFTDALNMQGVAKYFDPGDVDLRAFMAGNDVLLFSQDVPTAIDKIQKAINEDRIPRMEVELRVKKILRAKYDVGLANYKEINPNNATNDLNSRTQELWDQMAYGSVTFVRDRNKLINQLIRKQGSVRYIGVNASGSTELYNELKKELPSIKSTWLPKGASSSSVSAAVTAASGSDITIVAVHNMGFYPSSGGRYRLDQQHLSFLQKVQNKSNVILVLMGNPYLLQHCCNFKTVLVGYEDHDMTQSAMASTLLGITPAKGKLPVTPCDGMIMETEPKLLAEKPKDTKEPIVDRLTSVFFPADAGVTNSNALSKLNIFLERSVIDGVFPGCQVIAAKNGKVFYHRAFGYYDAYKTIKVDTNSIYDVASLTKVLSTTLAVMKLHEEGKLDINKLLVDYLPQTKGTDKERIVIKDLLLHQAGLKSWIPFYTETLDSNGKPDASIYHTRPDANYSLEVAKDLYMRNDYKDSIWKTIIEYPRENIGRYVYSDLDFYFLWAIVEKITRQPLDKYVEEQFYKPMGLKSICYNPLKKFPATQIVPTENDMYFRMQTIRGHVHDQGASQMGGVAGHAGIFSNAYDVAAVFQMLLQGGTYNGKRFFKEKTIGYFTAYNSRLSRRGLGFDKPYPDAEEAGPTSNHSGGYTFGHQGFTGTCAWADPETGVVFVFLSNRVNPSADNKKINRQSTRTVSQDYIYESLGVPVNRKRAEVKKEQLAK